MKFTFAPAATPLDGFTIRRAIHRGAFGEVYQATTDGGREVALKLLQNDLDVELRGVRQCLNLSHPNLVTLFDVRTDADGDHWIVMEYVAAPTLSQTLKANPNGVSVDEAIAWVRGIADGVGFLHRSGLVHRDIKPANVFGGLGETVQVGDVGLSKFIAPSQRSAQTQSVGTVYYMAPEVAKGKYGPEVDQYSLAVVAYELLTGRVPFDGESTGEILLKHLSESPNLRDVPDTVRGVLARGLAKDPQDRFDSIDAFAKAFEAALTGRLYAATGDTGSTGGRSSKRSNVSMAAEANGPDPGSWYDSLSPSRRGLIVFSVLLTMGVVICGGVFRPLVPILTILGGPALALAWHAEFDWFARFANTFSPDRGKRNVIVVGSLIAAALAFGRSGLHASGQLAILGTIGLVGLSAVWLVLSGFRLIVEAVRDELSGTIASEPKPLPPQQPTRPTETSRPVRPLAAGRTVPPPRDASIAMDDAHPASRSANRSRPTLGPTPRRAVHPLRPRLHLSDTLGAATVAPLIVAALVTLVGLIGVGLVALDADGHAPGFVSERDLHAFTSIYLPLFAGSSIVAVWSLLLARHLPARRVITRLATGAIGAAVGLVSAAVIAIGGVEFSDAALPTTAFFAVLFFLRDWRRQTDPLRVGRFRFASVLMSALTAIPAAVLSGVDGGDAMLWAAVVSSTLQIVAPYESTRSLIERERRSRPSAAREDASVMGASS